jgi:hypothetical protein
LLPEGSPTAQWVNVTSLPGKKKRKKKKKSNNREKVFF